MKNSKIKDFKLVVALAVSHFVVVSTKAEVATSSCNCATVEEIHKAECRAVMDNVSEDNNLNAVHKCIRKPWLAIILIENPEARNDDLESFCLGSIISKKHILTTASCLCNKRIKGAKCAWNDAKRGKLMENGRYEYINMTKGSRIDYDFQTFIRIVFPGINGDYRLDDIRISRLSNETTGYKASYITIHPDFIALRRPSSDIAIVQMEEEIELLEGSVMPICLPGKHFQDLDVEANIFGWGTLYEKYKEKEKVGCHTDGVGPAQFTACRSSFLLEGDVMEGCSNTIIPSINSDICAALYNSLPNSTTVHSEVVSNGNTKTTCYPTETANQFGWCATCDNGTQGADCSINDEEYEDDESYSSMTSESGWGMCDEKCFFNSRDLLYSDFLEEVPVHVLSKQDCLNRSYYTEERLRPQVDREICAIKSTHRVTHLYEGDKSSFKKIGERLEKILGGSESCQADSGSSLYVIDKNKVPVLLGLASRASHCAHANVNVIYTRITHYLNWIESVTQTPNCSPTLPELD